MVITGHNLIPCCSASHRTNGTPATMCVASHHRRRASPNMRSRISRAGDMHTQMTITSTARHRRWISAGRGAALVIIAAGMFGAPAGAADQQLTTAPAPVLTTVIVSGSSVYDPPRLFGTYRDQLGKAISRDGAGAITQALAALYSADGYVKPQFEFDDSRTAQGVLGVRVYEAQVTNVVFEGDTGAFRDALERIATELTAAKPLRLADVPQALRSMRSIAGLSVSATTRRDTLAPNAFELVVTSDFAPVDGVVRMNNRGTDQ